MTNKKRWTVDEDKVVYCSVRFGSYTKGKTKKDVFEELSVTLQRTPQAIKERYRKISQDSDYLGNLLSIYERENKETENFWKKLVKFFKLW